MPSKISRISDRGEVIASTVFFTEVNFSDIARDTLRGEESFFGDCGGVSESIACNCKGGTLRGNAGAGLLGSGSGFLDERTRVELFVGENSVGCWIAFVRDVGVSRSLACGVSVR